MSDEWTGRTRLSYRGQSDDSMQFYMMILNSTDDPQKTSKTVVEGVLGLHKKFDSIRVTVDGLDSRTDRISGRVEKLEGGMEKALDRLSSIDESIAKLGENVDWIKRIAFFLAALVVAIGTRLIFFSAS